MTRSTGLEDEAVEITVYDPSWPIRFETERALLDRAIGGWATGGIHHVGSTAVPGLAAKPVIDILVGVQGLASSRDCFEKLAEIEYQYAPYRAEEMHWFCKPDPSHRTHHLHLVPTGSRRYRAELAFRDALRSRSDLALDYANLKTALARQYKNDRERYTREKTGFIERELRAEEVDKLILTLTEWAGGQATIRALALVGSWARGDARADSDVDIVLLAARPDRYRASTAWLDVLDQPTVVREQQFGVISARRVRLQSGLEVEFGIGPTSWASTAPLDAGTQRVVSEGLRILHDPDGLLVGLQAAVCRSASEPKR